MKNKELNKLTLLVGSEINLGMHLYIGGQFNL